jgi:hypothetical protein
LLRAPRPERSRPLLAERLGVPRERITIGLRYYGEHPDEVDRFIAIAEEESERLEQTLEGTADADVFAAALGLGLFALFAGPALRVRR